MNIERPTFSESWHRVAEVRCQLRGGVRVVRQRYRGQVWHVAQDLAANQFFRFNEPAYHFIGLLDGRRTVAEAWRLCNQRLGDEAPTQGEVIQILGQLYTSNLLRGDLPGDAETVLRRRRTRVNREVRGYLSNLLFLRIPVVNPDALLSRWHPMVGRLFTRAGLLLWLALLVLGAAQLAGRERELFAGATSVLDPSNVFLLYITFAFIKLVHELAHGFACKVFGVRESGLRQGAGEVRVMGLMLMVFVPVPYVDASSSWALRGKSRRVIVALAGIMAELALAAVAAIVWSRTSDGTVVHAIAYNAMFVASVSTLVFNGNPLLRYDGYYALADLIEIPNLAQRSNQYVQYLIKKYIWGVKRLSDPSVTDGERAWMLAYAPASMVYRVFVFGGILLFVSQQWFIIGVIFALFGLATWLVVPTGRFVRYLATSPELVRARPRAMCTSGLTATAVAGLVGLLPVPEHARAEGVVEPSQMAVIHARSNGFITSARGSGETVVVAGETLIEAENWALRARRLELGAEYERLTAARRQAIDRDAALAAQLGQQLAAIGEQIDYADSDLTGLRVAAPLAGVWVSPDSDRLPGAYRDRGEQLGIVADLNRLIVRATATQGVGARVIAAGPVGAEVRVKGRPEQLLLAQVRAILPAGQEQLPSRALGFDAGGPIQVDPTDSERRRAVEPFFEIRLELPERAALLPGQRVITRFRLGERPIAAQAWHRLSQVLQQKFRM